MMPEMLERLERALAGRYRVDRELGHGGMAVVFLATDLKHQRQVAIKVLKPELSYAIGTERFLREIAIAARLNHPHILSLHDSGDAGGLLYYVMPFVEGESLRDRLDRETRLPAGEAIRIACEVADALAYAHDQGLIHRDIKPENILLQAGHALVSDFGIARAVSAADGDRLTQTGIAIGTPAYMSPEQSLGGRQLDGRSDVYSLGCVLYEMLAGTPPFDGPSVQAIVAGHAVGVVPPLHRMVAGVPANIEAAVHLALAKQPDDRFASPRAFAAALEGGSVRTAARWSRGRIRAPLSIAAIVAVLAGGSAVAWRQMTPAGPPSMRSLAVLPLENLSRDSSQEYLVAGIHEALIEELARISALRVISRTSTLAYRGGTKSVPEIARELAVDGVVEGSVLRRGDSVRIQVQLIRARPEERQVWAHAYERNLSHVLSLYSDVAQAVARQVQAEVTPLERARFATAGSVDPAAYESYLKGKFHWLKLTPGDLDASFDYFQLALKRDATFALAYSGIAEVWIARLQMGLLSPAAALPKASAAALHALQLDSGLAEGHHDLALIRTQTWDWPGAEAAFQRTFALNPAFAESRAYYSHLLNILGRPAKAREQMDQAIVRDPLNPLFRALDAVNRLFERRWDDAIEQATTALRTAPGHPVALIALFQALDQRDRHDEAVRTAAQYLESTAQPVAAAALTRGYAAGGYREAMRRGAAALGAAEASGYVTASDVALLYAVAGDNLMALQWLERAYDVRDPNLPYLGLPCFDAVRADPRFQALLRRMRLT
jgi:serine/threonine-protein kinase